MKPDWGMWWGGFFIGVGLTFGAIWLAVSVVGW